MSSDGNKSQDKVFPTRICGITSPQAAASSAIRKSHKKRKLLCAYHISTQTIMYICTSLHRNTKQDTLFFEASAAAMHANLAATANIGDCSYIESVCLHMDVNAMCWCLCRDTFVAHWLLIIMGDESCRLANSAPLNTT